MDSGPAPDGASRNDGRVCVATWPNCLSGKSRCFPLRSCSATSKKCAARKLRFG